jgi:putative ABC transport system permease protein
MFGNHLRIAVRNLWKYPGHTAINLFGLTVGLTVCLLVTAYIVHELSFEDCHSKRDRIYRVQLDLSTETMGTMGLAGAAPPLGPALRETCPEVEAIARFRQYSSVKMASSTVARKEQRVLAVEPEFLDVFDVKSLRGEPKIDLATPFNVYLTPRLATSLFGQADPIGQSVTMEGQVELHVAGILDEFPSNTQLKCDALASYSSLEARGTNMNNWMQVWVDYLYVLLRPGAEVASLEAALPSILTTHLNEEQRSKQHYVTAALGDIYLNPRPANELTPQGSPRNLWLFGAVALVTLAIACVNFVNHTTARATSRVKELSVRKIVGAGRTELIRQLLTESLLVAALASLAAMAAFELSASVLSLFLDRRLDVGLMQQPLMVVAILGLTALVGLTAGAYPAFYMSRTRPLQFLKGGSGVVSQKSRTRRALVIFQFATAIILTAVATVVLSQIRYSRTWDKGFDDHDVLVMEFEDEEALKSAILLKNELAAQPGVLAVSACNFLPGTQNMSISFFRPSDHSEAEPEGIRTFRVDPDFASTLGLSLADGRNLTAEDAASDGRNVVLDQQAVEALGLKHPVGTMLTSEDGEVDVVGVLKDFHAVPTFSQDWPTMMHIEDEPLPFLLVKLRPEDAAATVGRIKGIWEKSVPTQPFEYSYYDQYLARLYGDHEKFGTLLGIFSIIALVIAGLGVFSLASYAAERRRREIGIRKVVGATIASILRLLCSEFVVLVTIAAVIGCPVAWYLSNKWLERFVYHIDLGPGLLLLAGAVSLIVAVLSVSLQSLRAARANPVESLSYE